MKDIVAYHGLKRFPFDKNIKSADILETEPQRECAARLDFIKRRGGIMLLVGDPGVGKTLALRRFCDSLNENIYRAVYTPLSTLRGADLLRHINDRLGLPNRASKAAVYGQIQQEILDSREQRGRTVVLIIDEANLLRLDVFAQLHTIAQFELDSKPILPIILSGQNNLPGSHQRFASNFRIRIKS